MKRSLQHFLHTQSLAMKNTKNGINRFMNMLSRNFTITNSANGLAICIGMVRWRSLQKEIYSKGLFICHGRIGIVGNYWKNFKRNCHDLHELFSDNF